MYNLISMYWRDIAEICLFTLAFYYTALWLKKDRSHNLLPYFYAFIVLCFGCHALNLTSASLMLLYTWPLVLMLFVLMHPTHLQRNFVALKNSVQEAQKPLTQWLEAVIAHSLVTLNQGNPIYCVIEHTDSLSSFVTITTPIHAPLSAALLDFISSNPLFNPHQTLVINTQGMILGANATWRHTADDASTPLTWLNTTILHTHTTDSFAFYGDPITHTFTAVVKNKTIPSLSANQLLHLIKAEYTQHYSASPEPATSLKKQETAYVNFTQKSAHEQRTP